MLKVLFLLSAVAFVFGVSGEWGVCICGSFLRCSEDGSRPNLDSKIFKKTSHVVEDCDAPGTQKNCTNVCVEKIKLGTGGGCLDYVTPEGSTVGARACLGLRKDVKKGEPAIFSKVCDGEWEFGMASDPPYLTCKDGKYVASG